MTEEEKRLLLKDLCARLAYGVTYYYDTKNVVTPKQILSLTEINNILLGIGDNIKPYLRPMSSMTDEEIDRMWEIYDSGPAAESSVAVTGYLYERGLDCHHLIEKGLALEAPKDMYKTE